MSLGASQQLGKALVFFGWKGLDCVREYVIPANPRTDGQVTQRGYLTAAVSRIHAAQGRATNPLDADDVQAYALWASVVQAATTWFNQAVKHLVNQQIDGNGYPLFYDGSATPGVGEVVLQWYAHLDAPDDATIFYGTSKTALINSEAASIVGSSISKTISGLTAGTKYYFQLRANTGDPSEGARSGIYYATPT